MSIISSQGGFLIDCRECDSPDCRGCNMYRLAAALGQGKLDWAKNDHNGIEEEKLASPAVVLCEECELWNEWDRAGNESLGNLVCSCAHWTVENGVVFRTRPTDFCSYAERKEEA